MKVLIVGSGGREHALAWKIQTSPKVTQVYVAGGNGGTASLPHCQNIEYHDIDSLISWAQQASIDLCVVGPELPLSQGIVDRFSEHNISCFGPTQQAAQLESSKRFSKDFMQKYGIPTARYHTANTAQTAKAALTHYSYPIVLKASGLAAGKGVIIANSEQEAILAIDDLMLEHKFGSAADELVIEEFLEGVELSFITLCAHTQFISFASSQDHKRRDDGDRGPNTGGMGAYSPSPHCTAEIQDFIERHVIQPTLDGMMAEDCPYTGFLYAGIMLTEQGPKVLEYNCRFGDPEAQVILPRLESDLIPLIEAALTRELHTVEAHWSDDSALGIVMASGGYPESYQTGYSIDGLDQVPSSCLVFHAGTQLQNKQFMTHGGRVLCLVATGSDLKSAYARAYQTIKHIRFDHCFYRNDIGHKALDETTQLLD